MMNEAKDNAKLAFYQNPSYQLERRRKRKQLSLMLKLVQIQAKYIMLNYLNHY